MCSSVRPSCAALILLHSVDRDDLPDGGSSHIAKTIALLKERTSGRLLVEALVPDFQGDMKCVKTIVGSGLDVFAHNIETVERLQGEVRDRRAAWNQSMGVLRAAKEMGAKVSCVVLSTSSVGSSASIP